MSMMPPMREKYLKTAWGKRYIKGRLRRYLTGQRRFRGARNRRISSGSSGFW